MTKAGPLSVNQQTGDVTRAAGGVVTAFTYANQLLPQSVWVWAEREDSRLFERVDADGFVTIGHNGKTLHGKPISIPAEIFDSTLEKMANPLLWFFHHGMVDLF